MKYWNNHKIPSYGWTTATYIFDTYNIAYEECCNSFFILPIKVWCQRQPSRKRFYIDEFYLRDCHAKVYFEDPNDAVLFTLTFC